MSRTAVVTLGLAAAACVLALAGGSGCGSNSPTTGPSGTGGITVVGTGGMGGGGGAGASDCPAIDNVGDTVTQEQASGALPTPMGGTIADGTYVLTRSEVYPPLTADPPGHLKETLRIAGTVLDIAVTSDDFPNGFTARANFGASGTELSLVYLCGPGANSSFTVGYTATATELVLMSDTGTVSTFTKR